MGSLYLLGTGSAVSDPHRTTTMLAVSDGALGDRGSLILIDCGGDAFQRLLSVGLDPGQLEALIVTHEHPDHVAGFPLLMEKLWVFGRRRPLEVHGIAPAIEQARRTLESFDFSRWDGFPEAHYHEVSRSQGAPVLRSGGLAVCAAPGMHGVPTAALKVKDTDGGGVVVYSSDTQHSDAVVELARGAEILVHEATGDFPGHSSALQAAQVGAAAGVRRLLLVHLPPKAALGETQIKTARAVFPALELGEEGGCYRF